MMPFLTENHLVIASQQTVSTVVSKTNMLIIIRL